MRKRRDYAFSGPTKEEARKRAEYKCQHCGKSQKELGYRLEVHHLLPCMVAAIRYPHILPNLVKSINNAICLCKECHERADQESFRNHEMYAQALLAIARQPALL